MYKVSNQLTNDNLRSSPESVLFADLHLHVILWPDFFENWRLQRAVILLHGAHYALI
jgi:hypothetical protein